MSGYSLKFLQPTRLMLTAEQSSGAIFSASPKRWRYLLWRRWDGMGPLVQFVGLNPSTADETKNDPTMRRCISFAKAWGYGGFIMTNLYAERSPDPDWIIECLSDGDPVGPENDEYLRRAADIANSVVVAWGSHKATRHRGRADEVLKLLYPIKPTVFCLGKTADESPRHPLYVKASTPLTAYIKLGLTQTS